MPAGQQYGSNAPQTSLVGGINNSQNTGTVASFTGYPAVPFTAAIDIGTPSQELVDVLAVSGTSITNMTRGLDGSSAQAHSNNATFTHVNIARDSREARAHMDASSSPDSTGLSVHGLTSGSSVVGTTDVQTLTNKTINSPTITGTANIGNPNITGTVTGAAQYQNITVGTTGTGLVPLTVNALSGQTADVFDVQINGVTKLSMGSDSGVTAAAGSYLKLKGFVASTQNDSRYVGATAGGAPASGTFVTGDWAIDRVYGGVWVNSAGGSPGTFLGSEMLLATTTLGSDAATITLSSIPAGFTDLILYVMGRSSGSLGAGVTDLRIQFNGDTAANYGGRQIYILNSGTVSGGANNSATNGNAGFITDQSAGGSTTAGFCKVVIPYYTTVNWSKQYIFQSQSGPTSVSWQTGSGGGIWASTSAITSITLLLADGSNFKANTLVQLFGRP